MRKNGDMTVYETLSEIRMAIEENGNLHDARLVDVEMASDSKNAEFAFQRNKYVLIFRFLGLSSYRIDCNDMTNLYLFYVDVTKEKDGYETIFDGIGMALKSENLELVKRYNGLI